MDDGGFTLGFAMGVFAMGVLILLSLVIPEPKWVHQAYEDKRICEETISRNETCVLIALPRSKD